MPWDKREADGKWEVINSDTGDVKGVHDSESEADDQLAALYANANPEDEKVEKANFFIPITKVDAERREVWGWGAIEEPDNSDEILDYETSKPHFLDWSNRAQKRSGGKSLGNVRAMHKNVAAGKLIELRPDDVSKGFYVGAKIVDDKEWRKVEEGVYTGFSVGGSYLKRWSDFRHPGKVRYTAKPSELSIVDSPCIPSATFEMVKADGIIEEVEFSPGNGANILEIDYEDDDLEKWEESKHKRADDGKFTSGGGGGDKKPAEPIKRSTPSGGVIETIRHGNGYAVRSREMQGTMILSKHPTFEEANVEAERLYNEMHGFQSKGGGIKAGSRVRFKNPNPDEDPNDEYHVVEERGDRTLIEYHDKNKKFGEGLAPRHVVPTADLEGVGDEPKGMPDTPKKPKNPSPTTPQGWADKAARNGSYRHMSDEEYANEVNDLLIEKHPELKGKHDKLADLIQSSVNQRRDNFGKITKGDIMTKLERIYELLDAVEVELQKAVPEAPEPVADIPLKGDYGSEDVEQMPPPSVLMELEQNGEPSQEVLATHAVNTQDLTSEMNAWLPKVGAVVKKAVAESLEEALSKNNTGDNTNPAPEREVLVKRGKSIKVIRKEN